MKTTLLSSESSLIVLTWLALGVVVGVVVEVVVAVGVEVDVVFLARTLSVSALRGMATAAM